MIRRDFSAILEAAEHGDEDAFRSLFRSVQPGLLRYLGALAGPLAEDIAADTWVGVVRNLGGFTGDESGFDAWVFTIARARLRDEQRRVYRRPTPAGIEHPPAHAAQADPDLVEQQVDEGVGTAAALALIATLPRIQAEAVLLRHVVGFDVAETARIMGKQPGAVRVADHRGLARLRSMVDSEAVESTGGTVTNLRLPAMGEVR